LQYARQPRPIDGPSNSDTTPLIIPIDLPTDLDFREATLQWQKVDLSIVIDLHIKDSFRTEDYGLTIAES
jgi:hypothetical protein